MPIPAGGRFGVGVTFIGEPGAHAKRDAGRPSFTELRLRMEIQKDPAPVAIGETVIVAEGGRSVVIDCPRDLIVIE